MDAWLAVLPNPLTAVALASLAFAAMLLLGSVFALRRGRLLKSISRMLLAAVFALAATTIVMLAIGVQGYRALTKEHPAAVVSVEPVGHQRFTARFLFPDGRRATYTFAGDELYVDARILKWKYWANVVGLHTAYELDRISGRYRAVRDEISKPRTLESLARERDVDLFSLRRRFEALSPFYDAEYGSAVYVAADSAAMYEILVSTTGLLARPVRSPSDTVSE